MCVCTFFFSKIYFSIFYFLCSLSCTFILLHLTCFQTIVGNFPTEKPRLSNIEESFQKVLKTTHADGHENLSNDIKEVEHKFDSTEESAKSCCSYLEELLKQLSDYEKRINEVQGWMKDIENSLQSICLKEGLQEKRAQLEKIKVKFLPFYNVIQ